MPFVEMAAFDTAARFMTGFSGSRAEAIIGNFVRARGLGVIEGQDMERTGTVDKFYTDSLRRALDMGMTPILPCIGWSPAGKAYNVPSEEIALQAAASLQAVKLFIVTLEGALRQDGYTLPLGVDVDKDGRVIRLRPTEAAELISLNPLAAAKSLSSLSLAVRAIRYGVERVHIVSGRDEGAVLREIFSNLGSGTMVYADEYESIRPLRNKDVPDVLRLMEPLMEKGVLVRRTAEDISSKIGDYAAFDIDGHIHACGALHDWGESQGEIAALATDPAYSGFGFGRRVVGFLITRARKLGMKRVFVLTTKTHDWFESLGFREAPVESLPERKRLVYNYARASKVFALDLQPL
jgi:amino-acid N-acetyltransferase